MLLPATVPNPSLSTIASMTQHTLISFLGNVPAHRGGEYRRTTYEWEQQRFDCSFLGLGLAQAMRVPRLRILGTAGSMWDVLAEHLGATADAEAWVELSEAVRENRATAALLQTIENQLNQAQSQHRFELRLIPYGYDESTQVEILRALSEGIDSPGHQVTLDITHGFRHLPMLGFLSMMYLKSLGHASVRQILYGAFDAQQDGITPVVNLAGMMHIQEWIKCLDQFDKDGDYGIFGALLTREGIASNLLEEASFLERIGNLSLARKKLDSFWQSQATPKTPASNMFLPLLRKRLEWRRSVQRSEWERKLAEQFLARKDYLRCVIFCYESRISAEVESAQGDPNNYEADRSEAEQRLQEWSRTRRLTPENERNFYPLKFLRNQLAHGVRGQVAADNPITRQTSSFVQSLVGNERKLHDWLAKVLKD